MTEENFQLIFSIHVVEAESLLLILLVHRVPQAS